ncbi:arginine--tRNA ligase [Pantanalinema rosaneae CENA516]|uniref:arginine--tRNA ligase n=1 Tax=Pantanalinema rosaneae TaxID=1620701 RepID=UPI003D6FE70A
MNSTIAQLKTRFEQALISAFGAGYAGTDPMLVPASNPKFGDYQSNVALSLAKPLGQPPRAIAEQLVQHLDVSDFCEPPTIAGPGFINLTWKSTYLEAELRKMQTDFRLGVDAVKAPKRIVVDFSSPNIAKEMHVGHLRSTIIGDSIARILEFQGHDVLRLNHVGDWGTQFGMLITYLREVAPEALTTADAVDLGDLVAFYKQAKQRFDEDEAFKEISRQEVVKLQSGDQESRRAWELLCEQSRREFQIIYDRLDIHLNERGESFYNPLLPGVVEDLERAGLLVEDDGAKCVFLDGFTNKDGKPLPLIIQKSDGGYNYATTDLAAIRYRINQDGAERLVYITDAGQANHFAQVFQVARRAGWLPDTVEVIHVPFGLVKGEDGKKLKTRSGETVRLRDLLDEAIARARFDLEIRLKEEARQETSEFVDHVAQTVGVGAVKYADLSQNRTSDYVFSYDKMLALQGNTAPYMLYAYVRIQGISRKGGIDFNNLTGDTVPVIEAASATSEPPHAIEHSLIELPPAGMATSQFGSNWQPWLTNLLANWKPILLTGLGIYGLIVFVQALLGLFHGINTVPFAQPLFELIGIWATVQFATKRLLFARDRDELITEFQAFWHGTIDQLAETADLNADRPVVALLPKSTDLPAITPVEDHTLAPVTLETLPISLQEETELALAKHLLQLNQILNAVEADLLPNRLCQYLFELSQKFNQFYDRCPVLQADEPLRTSRLVLCDLTARTLKLGLSLLGIPVLERM